jgi:hypothetical protein
MDIRRCLNCVFWKRDNENLKSGQCTLKPYYFAFALTPNLYPYTKHFFVCDKHRYDNENASEVVEDTTKSQEVINNLDTYHNRNGFPIIRRCQNCDYWRRKETGNFGHCTKKTYDFAFDKNEEVQSILFANTKDFFLCESHKLFNEEKLSKVSDKVKLKDIIKKKSEI